VLDYFSYEHFYVLYCKFWELDADHDFLLDRDDLVKFCNYIHTHTHTHTHSHIHIHIYMYIYLYTDYMLLDMSSFNIDRCASSRYPP
jgi:hypothetical protein